MTGMLASVTTDSEASIVLAEAVDIIDLKNPLEGALGALNTCIVSKVVNTVNKRVITSATIGDVDPNDPELLRKIEMMAATGVDIVKVGLFTSMPTEHFIYTLRQACAQKIELVIVLLAEHYLGIKSVNTLLQTGIKGVMLDTKNKNGIRLTDILSVNSLKEFVELVRMNGLLTGLAGSLRLEDIDSLLELKPDYLGFRGALCVKGNRISQLDQYETKKIRNAIPQIQQVNYDRVNKENEVLRNGTMA